MLPFVTIKGETLDDDDIIKCKICIITNSLTYCCTHMALGEIFDQLKIHVLKCSVHTEPP